MEAWLKQAQPEKGVKQYQQLVVYVPAPKPETEEDKCRDPFQVFALGGAVFPEGDGDKYQALCRRAKPYFAAQIEMLFQAGVPDFATVDKIGAGKDWPRLRTLLGVESAAEILTAFLSPTEPRTLALSEDASWQGEFREFCADVLGYTLKTKGQKWATLGAELWRFILFSEFAFDLPGELPSSLRDVPRAGQPYEDLVRVVCKNLRDAERHHARYMEQAEQVASELKLEAAMRGVEDLGVLDTLHRAFEQSVADSYENLESLDELVEAARQKYRTFSEALQAKFVNGVVAEGWPASGRVRNTEVFNRWVAPALKERGKRVALVLVDALRYELAVELEAQLAKEGSSDLTTRRARQRSSTTTPA